MANWRMMPPASGSGVNPITVAGRTYSAAIGATLDVPDFDAVGLRANGWTVVGLVGTTAQRPSSLPAGIPTYVDTTINKIIVHDGKTFRDHTGSAV